MLENEPSTSYSAILAAATPENLKYHGSAVPLWFGAIRNTLDWKGVSFSFNVSYRLGYYFRRESVRYSNVLTGIVSHGDYALRWQQPGDEETTQVPSMPAVSNSARDNFYLYSEALVEKGDHIRLQDVSLSYDLPVTKLPLKRAQIYFYANNLGIIWKATKSSLDPDVPTTGLTATATTFPSPKAFSFGLKLQL